jgi:rRNA maturation protein Rpf1
MVPAIDIKADPYHQFKLREIIERDLATFGADLRKLKIKVTITDLEEPAAFSEMEIIKEHKKMVAKIEIYDAENNLISETSVDSIAMYDVSDEFPYSGKASRQASIDALISDLGHSIALSVVSAMSSSQ